MPIHTNRLRLKDDNTPDDLFSAILDIAHDAIIAVDQDQNIVLFNQGAKRIFGYENASEVIGKPLDILLPPNLSEVHRTHLRDFQSAPEMARQMGKRRAEISGRRKDGTIFPAEANIAKVSIGEELIFTVILRDITERKQAEQQRQTLIESMPDGVLVVNMDGIIVVANAQIETLFGYPRAELLGKPIEMLLPENVRAIHPKHRDGYLAAPKTRTMGSELELYARRKDGSEFPVDISLSATETEQGMAAISVIRDITARKQVETRIETQMQRLAALRIVDTAINGNLDLQIVLNVVLKQTTVQLGMDAASVLLLNPHTHTLSYAAGSGYRTPAIEQSQIQLGEGIPSKVIDQQRVIHLHKPLQSPDFLRAALLVEEGFIEYYTAPMISKGKIVGVLEVFHRAPYEADKDWLIFLETLAGQAAIAVDNAQLFQNLQHSNANLSLAYDATIKGWSAAMDLRDKETEGHTQRVTELTVRLARARGISEADIVHIRRGALLHDMGKLGVPDAILLKSDKLTEEEWILMRQHPQFAYDMLASIEYLRPALDIPHCHHEKWDGTGYPRRLKGEQIPLAARLFAVVDVWDALRSDRPYRQAWSEEEVVEHIKSLSGTHFEPKAVELFLKMMNKKEEA